MRLAPAPSAPDPDPTSEPLWLPTDALAPGPIRTNPPAFLAPSPYRPLIGSRRRHGDPTPKGWEVARTVGSADLFQRGVFRIFLGGVAVLGRV